MTRPIALAALLLLLGACRAAPPAAIRGRPSTIPARHATLQARAENSCKIEFASPGGTCGEHGECPYRVHREILWGLIEYDTDVLICFCLVECEVDIPLLK